MAKSQNYYGILRLKSKDARNAIIQKLATDFNLTSIIADAYFQQFSLYFEEHANVSLMTDQDQITQLTRLSKRVVQQYADLLPEKIRKNFSKNKDESNKIIK